VAAAADPGAGGVPAADRPAAGPGEGGAGGAQVRAAGARRHEHMIAHLCSACTFLQIASSIRNDHFTGRFVLGLSSSRWVLLLNSDYLSVRLAASSFLFIYNLYKDCPIVPYPSI